MRRCFPRLSRLATGFALALIALGALPQGAAAQSGNETFRQINPRIIIADTPRLRLQGRHPWLGIAASRDGRVVASSGQQASEGEAQHAARQNCLSTSAGSDCISLLAVRDACIGWAVRPDGWAVAIRGASRSASEAEAARSCRSRTFRAQECSTGSICTPGRG